MILLKTIELPSANQHLPEPFKADEVVKFIGENPRVGDNPTFSQQFIQVERMKSKRKEVFHRKYFIDAKTKQPLPYPTIAN